MTRTGSPYETSPSALGGDPTGDPPRPSAALLAHVAKMRPVRPRVPRRSLLMVALVAGTYPAWALTALPLRSGLAGLSVVWVAGVGALWLAGFIVPLTFALLPGTGHVVPDGKRAFRTACLTAILVIGASLLLGVDVFGGSRATSPASAESLAAWRGCVTGGLRVSAPVIVAGTLALRRVAFVQPWRLGAALGAAGGSLAGLTLHLSCSNGQPLHVLLAHAGGVVIGALAGALSLVLLGHRRR
jgi:Negative regulator of sigma F